MCSKYDACLCLVWKEIQPIQVNWLPLSLKERHENLHNKSHFNELTSQICVETDLKAKHSSTSSLVRRATVPHERGCYQLLSPLYKGTLQSPKTGQCLCKLQETDPGPGNRASARRHTSCLSWKARSHEAAETSLASWRLIGLGQLVGPWGGSLRGGIWPLACQPKQAES